ncbi:MAG: alpha/beta fold hydrolase [Candidatus Heimdallarchaeota archaeon]
MSEIVNEFDLSDDTIKAMAKLIESSRREVPNFYDEGESEVFYIPVEDGELRVFHHKPDKITTKRPVLFLPGFGTTPWTWRKFHYPHHGIGEFYNFETREKASSTMPNKRKVKFTYDIIAQEIATGIEYLGLNKKDYVLFGSSFNGGVVMKGLIEGYFNPPTTVVFDPLCVFDFLKFIRNVLLPITPSFVLGAGRKIIAKFIMRNMKNEAQRERNMAFVEGAVPYKWKKTNIQNRKIDLKHDLHKIKNEVFITHGPKDKFHPGEAFYNYTKLTPKGRLIYLNGPDEDRELIAGILGTAFMNVTKDDGMPEILKPFEIDLKRE